MITILRRIACRRNVNSLTDQQKQAFVNAVLALKASGGYNQYVTTHADAMDRPTPSDIDPSVRNAAHRGPCFLPWHRELLRRFEQDLRNQVPGVALPYWDWASDQDNLPDPKTSPVWAGNFMGGDGDPNENDLVKTGPFAFDPDNPNAWTVIDADGNPAGGLRRQLGRVAPTLPTGAEVSSALGRVPYDTDPWHRASSPSFRNELEGWPTEPPFEPRLHNRVHVWVGGDMLPGTSPNDPVFFLNHCMVDKLWAEWQTLHPDEGYRPTGEGPEGHNLNDALYPWTTRPADVLNHRDCHCVYDTDPAVIILKTPDLRFADVPAGETAVRDAVFEVTTCRPVRLEVVGGPGPKFETVDGTSVVVDPGEEGVVAEASLKLSYTGTSAGDTAQGSITVRHTETGQEWSIPITANTIA